MLFTFTILHILVLSVVWLQAANSLKGKSPDEAPGVVLLDSITFPKVVPSCTANVMVLFLDKRQIGQPTTDGSHDNFLSVSRGMNILYPSNHHHLFILTYPTSMFMLSSLMIHDR